MTKYIALYRSDRNNYENWYYQFTAIDNSKARKEAEEYADELSRWRKNPERPSDWTANDVKLEKLVVISEEVKLK